MVSGGTVNADLSSLLNLFNSFNGEISGLSGSWQGASHDNLVSKSEAFLSEASGGINSQMSSFASACDLYLQYDQTKQALQAAQSNYNSAVSRQDSSYVTTYGNEIASYQSKLQSLKNQIESYLSSASSFHYEATSLTGNTAMTDLSTLGTPSFGSFTEKSFTASNGLTLSYYLYQPDYGKEVSGLPVILYMHGGGSNNSSSSLLARGLSKELRLQTVNPSGMAVIPFIQNFSDKRNVEALKELMDDVVSTYNCDPNRISVSGHSSGAITTYKLINQYPDYFSAAIPISGWTSVNQNFTNTRIWAFNGKLDTGGSTSWQGAVNAVKQINSLGGDATLHTYEGYGHGYVQDFTYENEYESPDGDVISPLEWAYRQVRKTTTV